eukprot:TRINITY_DN2418_c2_g1_i1.p1 TRINITY_DN2418_c2_g1~~TRINITY_DN2418_c2_g1_i1.p1  ORF type:complete len:549 (+),score=150.26 TRINITY_DN2418_c2_g1_i1:31-1647(+)
MASLVSTMFDSLTPRHILLLRCLKAMKMCQDLDSTCTSATYLLGVGFSKGLEKDITKSKNVLAPLFGDKRTSRKFVDVSVYSLTVRGQVEKKRRKYLLLYISVLQETLDANQLDVVLFKLRKDPVFSIQDKEVLGAAFAAHFTVQTVKFEQALTARALVGSTPPTVTEKEKSEVALKEAYSSLCAATQSELPNWDYVRKRGEAMLIVAFRIYAHSIGSHDWENQIDLASYVEGECKKLFKVKRLQLARKRPADPLPFDDSQEAFYPALPSQMNLPATPLPFIHKPTAKPKIKHQTALELGLASPYNARPATAPLPGKNKRKTPPTSVIGNSSKTAAKAKNNSGSKSDSEPPDAKRLKRKEKGKQRQKEKERKDKKDKKRRKEKKEKDKGKDKDKKHTSKDKDKKSRSNSSLSCKSDSTSAKHSASRKRKRSADSSASSSTTSTSTSTHTQPQSPVMAPSQRLLLQTSIKKHVHRKDSSDKKKKRPLSASSASSNSGSSKSSKPPVHKKPAHQSKKPRKDASSASSSPSPSSGSSSETD